MHCGIFDKKFGDKRGTFLVTPSCKNFRRLSAKRCSTCTSIALAVTRQTDFHPNLPDFGSRIHPCELTYSPNAEQWHKAKSGNLQHKVHVQIFITLPLCCKICWDARYLPGHLRLNLALNDGAAVDYATENILGQKGFGKSGFLLGQPIRVHFEW